DTGRFRFEPVARDIEALNQRSAVRSQRSEGRDQRAEVRSQKSEVKGHSSEVRGQKSENDAGDSWLDPVEITAISAAQYPFVQDRYALTVCGSSMGENYGPKIVARSSMVIDDLRGGGQRSEVRDQRSEVRSQRSEVR